MTRKLQIGVVGSMADLNYSMNLEELAARIGQEIADTGYVLVFGAEKDADSLPTVAARAAVKAGGITVGITYERDKDIFAPEAASVVIATGLVRGGGREMVQALSCDGIIAIGGGSGTLNELAVAYQANIPAVVMLDSGGWSAKLAGQYLDERQRYRYASAKNAEQALKKLIKMIQSNQENKI